MNPSYSEFKFPQIKQNPWNKIFRSKTPTEAIDLINHLLVYNPERRLKPLEALLHPFFDELRDENTRLPNKAPLPELFDFTKEELMSTNQETAQLLIPDWYRSKRGRKNRDGGL